MADKKDPGRPTKYKPEYCDAVIEHMSKGLSFESFAAIIGTHRDTLYEWVKVHPSFSDSMKTGQAKSLLFWESLGIKHIVNKSDSETFGVGQSVSKSRSLNAAIWCFNMKNRFNWSNKETIMTETDKPIEIMFNPKGLVKQA
jgi:hypothetical protein